MKENDKSSAYLSLLDKIKNREAVVGIIGLGYVGLPLAIHFGLQGFKVIGFDVDQSKVDMLYKGESYIKHIKMEHINERIKEGKFEATVDFSSLGRADCILICVPTPLTDKMEPDLSYVLDTTKSIADNLRDGQIIILESTTYPGTTEEELLPRLVVNDMKVGNDFFLAYSPEREDPGNKKYDAANIPKVVGGVTPACLEIASNLYNCITQAVPVSSTGVAEMTKILENTFRSVNIALVNELKVLGHKMGIDIFEVINAAATKPFGYTPFYPGPGLGGHCIPIDPFYLSWKAREYDFSTRFIQLAGEVNISMPYYVIERTIDALNQKEKSLKGSRIFVLGVAYKKDIDDDRESPGYTIMKMLLEKGALVSYNDPWVPMLKKSRKYNFQMKSTPITPEMLREMDAAVILADHSAYDYVEIVKHSNLIIDTRNATSGIDGAGKNVFNA
ncbi:MAG: nucleotide sugar dehydrogenase [Candidatus Scalindua rubra]|uniref:UDP-glucose/GDP-mannose dehydrogenase n=1 Tax=Candidatus Scalindua brodae TaxID=237368 RepID=A0A0B0EID9_9BACT|nr:MAG: UDP-glucose/GDP-mannose dehydrogenase [Candidatus Scalindua brodae]MBZ0108433.1 nucleotide sugar dehydrogenase [Candidatus Scalindua rubra]TWU28793.1 UDP-N-acetyl-D-glucosamine 6-dehydrogenase [Candidatus Brocadiaceae bacterium S225]